jgi:hypothetical protein
VEVAILLIAPILGAICGLAIGERQNWQALVGAMSGVALGSLILRVWASYRVAQIRSGQREGSIFTATAISEPNWFDRLLPFAILLILSLIIGALVILTRRILFARD